MKLPILLFFLTLNSIMLIAQTKIIAHRGFSSVAPENTLSAFQKAIEVGADYFELDVHKTKDGELVVIHDYSVDKTSSNGKTGKIAEMTSSEISEIKVGYPAKFETAFENEKIPTLREALQLAKGKIKVCIEIKVEGIEAEVLKIVNDLDAIDEVIVFCFSYPVVAKMRKLDKNIQTLYLISEANSLTADYATVIESNAIGVGSGTIITKDFLENAHNQGIEVWQWTVNDEEKMKELIGLGIDGLITDYPDKALKTRSSLKK